MPTTTTAQVNASTSIPWESNGDFSFFVLKNTIDFTLISGGVAQNDIVQCLNIPAGTMVQRVFVKVGAAAPAQGDDVDFGITGGDTDGFLDGVDIATTASTVVGATGGAYTVTSGGYYFAAADTIDMLNNDSSAIVDGSITVYAVCFRIL